MSAKKRGYSDKEVKEIIRKASQLENEEASSQGLLTLEDIQTIGKDLDISPAHIQDAAIDVYDTQKQRFLDKPLGASTTLNTKTTINHRIPDSKMDNLLSSMNYITDMQGSGSVIDNSLVWRTDYYEHQKRCHAIDIDIICTDNDASITVKDRIGGLAWCIFGGIIGGLGLGAGLGIGLPVGLVTLESPLFIVLFNIFTLLISFLLSRVVFKSVARHKE